MRPAILGVRFQFSVEILEGFFELVQTKIRKAFVKIDFGILRRAVQHFLERINGFGELQFGLKDDAQPFLKLRLVRIILSSLTINPLGPRVILAID